MRILLMICAIVLAILAIGVGASYVVLHPPEVKVAVPASDPLDQRVFAAASELLRKQGRVRLEMVSLDSVKQVMEALESGKVKLAVVRSDTAMQGRAQTLMIMRREVAVLIAPKTGKVQKVADLSGATVGVARDGPLDGGLMRPVLDYYGIARDKTKFVALPADEIANAFKMKKVDAIVAVGPAASKQMSDVVSEAARGVKGAIQFIDIEEADAIAKRVTALESVEIDQGAFGGKPPRPAESFNTLGYSVRLVSTQKLDVDAGAELMRQLYLIRQDVSATVPGAGLMEAPDTDEATPFLIHPGVRAYVNGEQRSFFERYSDYIYLFMFAGSGIGSVVTGLFGWTSAGTRDAPQVPVRRVEAVFDAVRDAKSREELDAAEREADTIFRSVFHDGAAGKLSEGGIASFGMAMNELRGRIAARRAAFG